MRRWLIFAIPTAVLLVGANLLAVLTLWWLSGAPPWEPAGYMKWKAGMLRGDEVCHVPPKAGRRPNGLGLTINAILAFLFSFATYSTKLTSCSE